MDQAERLRSIVKQKSENETEEQIIDSIIKAVENTENQVKTEEKKGKSHYCYKWKRRCRKVQCIHKSCDTAEKTWKRSYNI